MPKERKRPVVRHYYWVSHLDWKNGKRRRVFMTAVRATTLKGHGYVVTKCTDQRPKKKKKKTKVDQPKLF